MDISVYQTLFIVLHAFKVLNCIAYSFQSIDQSHVRFTAPLLDEGYTHAVNEYLSGEIKKKPLLLYLPGFDGTLLAPFLQFPELGTEFDVWGLTMEMDDRSTFEELKNHVLKFIEKYILESNGVRPFYMMGESFGSLLAIEVAHYIQTDLRHRPSRELLKGVVLINPATSYNKSQLAILGPDIASLSSFIYPFGLLKLLPLFTDDYAVPQLFMMLQGKALPLIINDKTREAYMGRVAFSLIHKLKFMPRETLAWRLKEWLRIGCNSMSAKEEKFTSTFARLPFLIVVGEKDKTLPSLAEATRLAGLFDCKIHIVDGSGHANTAGIRVDLTALMRERFGLVRKGESGDNKQIPVNNHGVMLGMGERYDKKSFGLSPLLYWQPDVYQKCVY